MSVSLSRRHLMGGVTGLALAGGQAGAAAPATRMQLSEQALPFNFEGLIGRARELAAAPYAPPPRPDPAVVERIDYDAYGRIRFDPQFALGPDGAVPLTERHVGRYFPKSGAMHLVENGQAREIVYDPGYFQMPADHPARALGHQPSAFAGYWLREPRSRGDWRALEPWATCLGASYWRTVGELGQVGLSARGVALDTGAPGPEEFPDFTAHWFESAASEGEPVVVHSLMESPSLTGAFRLAFHRDTGVTVEVEKHLFLRRPIARLGIAPLTSMYWYGEADRQPLVDWRPEVHDSDGLALWTGAGERLWRPLRNPRTPSVSSFADTSPKGFGLSQRDRDVEHYLDGVMYERRPSAWVEPDGDWGAGAVQLVELPTRSETDDNIVAMWVPRGETPAGALPAYRYRQRWAATEPDWPRDLARAAATRMGQGGEIGQAVVPGAVKFVVEFEGPGLERLRVNNAVAAEPVANARGGRIIALRLEPVPATPRWRVMLDVLPEGAGPVELRLYLRVGEGSASETWTTTFQT